MTPHVLKVYWVRDRNFSNYGVVDSHFCENYKEAENLYWIYKKIDLVERVEIVKL